MDLEAARKSLSKRSAFSTKKIAFVAVAGLVLVVGIGLRASHYLGETPAETVPAAVEAPVPVPVPTPSPAPAPEAASLPSAAPTGSVPKTAPAPAMQEAAPAPSEPAGQAEDAAEQTGPESNSVEQADLPGAGMILVARKPVQVLASPSASAPAMYGFPAGRPFRVIGREAGFVQIQDLSSSASGWIDEFALARPPRDPAASAPAQPKPFSVGRKLTNPTAGPKPKTTQKDGAVTAGSEVAAQPDRNRPGLFGRGGLFGGIFGNGN